MFYIFISVCILLLAFSFVCDLYFPPDREEFDPDWMDPEAWEDAET